MSDDDECRWCMWPTIRRDGDHAEWCGTRSDAHARALILGGVNDFRGNVASALTMHGVPSDFGLPQ